MRKRHNSIPELNAAEVVAAYSAGATTVDLAAALDVTFPTVCNFLRAHGVSLRSRSEINRLRAPVDDSRLRALNDEARLSQREIAHLLGVSQSSVERAMRHLGLKAKRGRGSPVERNFFWNGGCRQETEGYVLVKMPDHPFATKDGYVREHRLVMERTLGRYLTLEEVVHHKDGNTQNNDPENLEVFASQADHMRHEWATRWYPALQRLRERAQERAHLQASSSLAA